MEAAIMFLFYAGAAFAVAFAFMAVILRLNRIEERLKRISGDASR